MRSMEWNQNENGCGSGGWGSADLDERSEFDSSVLPNTRHLNCIIIKWASKSMKLEELLTCKSTRIFNLYDLYVGMRKGSFNFLGPTVPNVMPRALRKLRLSILAATLAGTQICRLKSFDHRFLGSLFRLKNTSRCYL